MTRRNRSRRIPRNNKNQKAASNQVSLKRIALRLLSSCFESLLWEYSTWYSPSEYKELTISCVWMTVAPTCLSFTDKQVQYEFKRLKQWYRSARSIKRENFRHQVCRGCEYCIHDKSHQCLGQRTPHEETSSFGFRCTRQWRIRQWRRQWREYQRAC